MMRACSAFLAALFALMLQPARAEVAPRTVQPSETFDVGMVRVERFGAPHRPAIVFIPALFCGSWQWNRQIAGFAKTNDVYVVTLPGFDGLVRDDHGDLMNRATADVDRLIRSRGIGPAVVVGHSLGGTLAVLFAEQYPNDVRALVSVEGGFPVADTADARVKAAENQAKPYDGVDSKTFDHVLRTTMLQYTIADKHDVDEVARLAERSDPTAIAQWLRAALSLDLTPQLSAINAPFTAIVPFDSRIDPYVGPKTIDAKRAMYERWLANVPHARVVMIAQSRHFVMFDQPQAFDAALRAALREAQP